MLFGGVGKWKDRNRCLLESYFNNKMKDNNDLAKI